MSRDIDFRAPGGRKSLWTTGKKKPDFHVSTVKSRNNQIWIFLFKGFELAHNSSASTFEVFGNWILAVKCSQSSDFGQLWGRFKKYTSFFLGRYQWEMFIWTFVYQACKNCRRNVDIRKMAAIWNWPYHYMDCSLLWSHSLGFSSNNSNGFFTKANEALLYFVIITILEHRHTL
jgi:hypothetical protein